MKTALEWAEYLPTDIKLWFIEECERYNRVTKDKEYDSLHSAIGKFFVWHFSELGYDFWDFVHIQSKKYKGREEKLLTDIDYIDESVPYTKSEVEAMILEYADPNDEVCKVMLANVMTKAYFPESEIMDVRQNLEDNFKPLHETKTTTMDGFYSKIKLEQENEALKSTIEGLEKEKNAIMSEKLRLSAVVQKKKVEISKLILSNHNINSDYEKLKYDLRSYNIYAESQLKPTPQPKTSLLQRFINWILS